MRTNRPVISLGPSGTDVEQIMQQYSLGKNFPWENAHDLKDFMRQQYFFFQQKKFEQPSERPDYSVFSNFNQTKKLATLLHEITPGK